MRILNSNGVVSISIWLRGAVVALRLDVLLWDEGAQTIVLLD